MGGLDEIDEEGFALGRAGERWLTKETDQSLDVTSLVMFRGDRRDARGKGFLRKTNPFLFFSLLLFLRRSVIAGSRTGRQRENTGGSLAVPFWWEDTSRNRLAGSCPVDRS